jgi:uncharacterized protein (UPF0333 family)
MRRFAKRLRSAKGQTMSEYLLLISVVVVATVAAAHFFGDAFEDGASTYGTNMETFYASSTGQPKIP